MGMLEVAIDGLWNCRCNLDMEVSYLGFKTIMKVVEKEKPIKAIFLGTCVGGALSKLLDLIKYAKNVSFIEYIDIFKCTSWLLNFGPLILLLLHNIVSMLIF